MAGLVAANLEKAPITGRPQLVFNMYKSSQPVRQGQPASMPELQNPYADYADPQCNDACSVLEEPGTLMLEASYKRIAKAVAGLAKSDPELEQHLADMPAKLQLFLFPTRLDADASTCGSLRTVNVFFQKYYLQGRKQRSSACTCMESAFCNSKQLTRWS